MWLVYFLISAFLLASIFYWRIFPVCYVEGKGLTPFKKISEYIISLVFAASFPVLYVKRQHFDKDVLHMLMAVIIFMIISELFFTLYISVYGISNLVGHLFKIISYYFLYRKRHVTL